MPKRSFPLPRGMKDIEADEMAQRQWVNNKIVEVLRVYGFQIVEPSPIESLETLEAKCGPSIREEIYWFEDKAGRKLGLRFDLTIGMARMVAGRYDIPMPTKLCAISNMWRYDEPQQGRYRCFYQWDAEIFGSPRVEADAEIISLSIDILKRLGLTAFETAISNRKFVEGVLNSIDIKEHRQLEATLRIIDKYRRTSLEDFTKMLTQTGLNSKQTEEVSKLVSIRGESQKTLSLLSELSTLNDKTAKGFQELLELIKILEAFGKLEYCIIDMSIVRGIGYYDGIVFEVYDKSDEEIGAIIGGGRFDGLCSTFGRNTPATGVAGGIERLMLALKKAKLIKASTEAPKIFVAAVDNTVKREVWKLVSDLRSHGIPTEFDIKNRNLSRQLEYVDSQGIPYAVIVGRREIETNKLRLRDMIRRKEEEVSLDEVPKKVLN